MKKILLAFWITCLCLNFSSCDEDDLVPPVSFTVDVDQIEIIPVHIDQTEDDWMTYSFKNTLTINNQDTKEYINKIKNVEITKLSYKVKSFNGDPLGEVKGTFMVANQISLENHFVVKTAADDQIIYEITEEAELNRIAEQLKSGQTVNIIYMGSALCNTNDMDFEIEVTLETKVNIKA
jgi:hypothetical protein